MTTSIIYFKEKSLVEWAKESLTSSEFAIFQAANEANKATWSTYLSQGLVSVETVYRQVFSNYLNTLVDIPIYKQMILADDVTIADIPDHPDIQQWLDRYNAAMPDIVIS